MTGRRINTLSGTVLLKLSGDVFAPQQGQGLDEQSLQRIAKELIQIQSTGMQLGIVVGGGNLWRGRDIDFIERISADQIGMMGTIINGLALQAALRQLGQDSIVQSMVPIAWADPIHPQRAKVALNQGKAVIFVGGTGNPLVSTDTAAAVRAVEIGATLLLKGSNIDGVYDDDPRQNPQARRFEQVSFADVLKQQLQIMDLGAFEICLQHQVPILVFDVRPPGNLIRVLKHPEIGTLIS